MQHFIENYSQTDTFILMPLILAFLLDIIKKNYGEILLLFNLKTCFDCVKNPTCVKNP